MIWVQIRTDTLSVLIWVQTVWKINQQMAKVAASKERVNVCFQDKWTLSFNKWYPGCLIVSIPDLCPLFYFNHLFHKKKYHVFENIMENGAFALLEQILHFP